VQPVPVALVLVVPLAAAGFPKLLAAAGSPPLPVAEWDCCRNPVVAVVGSGIVGSHCPFLTRYESRLVIKSETFFAGAHSNVGSLAMQSISGVLSSTPRK
jgi:hypothetical protein